MTNCPHCAVDVVDRRCGHEEQVCYNCCSTRTAVRTCAYHFSKMGLPAQATRSGAGLGPLLPEQTEPPSPPPPSLPPPGPAHVDPPAAAAVDLSALSALIQASIAAALQPQQAALAALHAEVAELRAATARPPPPSPPTPPLIPPPAAPVSAPAPSSPPPHRAAVLHLGGAAAATDSVNALIRMLAEPTSVLGDEESREVRPQAATHTLPPPPPPSSLPLPHPATATTSTPPVRFNPLPATMIPVEAGSVQDHTQHLIRLFTTYQRTAAKYASLKALDEHLEEWWEAVSKGGAWTGVQLMSLANYRAFLIQDLGPTRPLSKILAYHKYWSKAVYTFEHDMFQPGGHYVPHLFLKAGLLEPVKSSSSSSSSHKGGKQPTTPPTPAEPGAAAGSAAAKRHPDSGKYPAGSCTKHPTSTTHTTADCRSA